MNSQDLQLWTAGLAKVEAGAVDKLTDAEREVLIFYAGVSILERSQRPISSGMPPKNRAPALRAKRTALQTADLGPLLHTAVLSITGPK